MKAWGTRLLAAAQRSAGLRWLLVVLGTAVVGATLLKDGPGALAAGPGWLQALGAFMGVGILGAGLLLLVTGGAPRASVVRLCLAAWLAVTAWTVSLLDPLAAASWTLLGYLAAVCLLLPIRFGLLSFAGIILIGVALTAINRIKVELTGLPITMLDLRIAVANPAGLWDALALPHWSRHVTVGVLLVAVLAWVLAGLSSGWRCLARLRTHAPLEAGVRLATISAICIALWLGLGRLYTVMGQDASTWHPDRVARLANRTGILPFLAYSYDIESRDSGDIYRDVDDVMPPGPDELRASVLQYVEPANGGDAPRPNVAIVLAESTFDPARAFRLRGRPDGWLFDANELTVTAGPLRVNTRGGGTWVAEFETITGLDSRLFGYSGAYTHASLAPFVEWTFAGYLAERGYESWAFLANRGDFYNSRQAYEYYGFRHVLDSQDLGSEMEWFETDLAVVEQIIATLGSAPDTPLFMYVTLIENHGPHACGDSDATAFAVTFADTGEIAPNCALHEYLRRLDSTTAAVQALLRYLADLEQQSGHPFVLLVFGDHQPYTFTGDGEFELDFTAFRTQEDVYTTFFHILSSTGTRLDCCSPTLPVAALPTLVSGFVADGPEDLYLAENLWLYAQCGTDAVRARFSDRLDGLESGAAPDRTRACAAAYPRALAAFRRAGVIRLGQDSQ